MPEASTLFIATETWVNAIGPEVERVRTPSIASPPGANWSKLRQLASGK
jgi:hypothetical protein